VIKSLRVPVFVLVCAMFQNLAEKLIQFITVLQWVDRLAIRGDEEASQKVSFTCVLFLCCFSCFLNVSQIMNDGFICYKAVVLE
jgi:hypothetical protein